MSYYFEKAIDIGNKNIVLSFVYGLKLDLSFTAYLSIFPFLLVTLSYFINTKILQRILATYTSILIIVISLLMMIDIGLYKAWGVRLDNSFLSYIDTPELMIASTSTSQLLIGSIAWFIVSIIFIKFYKKIINSYILKFKNYEVFSVLIFLFITVSLIIPIRGGFQTIPINQSNVYFSNKMFANHAAVNFIWNFMQTIKRKSNKTNPYKSFNNLTAQQIAENSRNKLLKPNLDSILNTNKPNIIVLLWESLSAKIVAPLNGEKGVTPNLNKLTKEGVFFTNFYSNGDRTDKGIPAILSGYYPQPIIRIMRMPNKTRSLPMLTKELHKIGYTNSFYYGGDLNFGNMNTYLRNAEFDEIFDGSIFDKKDWNSKWGAYDDVFLKRLADDLRKPEKKPFFKVALTLSSHEPYEIKGDYKFGDNGESNKYRSAHFYTDKVIGDFIAFAKKQEWYKNTLIVIMSDHGHSSPTEDKPYFAPRKFHIPMLWLGGALHKKGIEINTITSQVDFAYTLLDLLKADNSEFVFGKNLFNTSENQYAHYVFNKGFGTLSKKGTFVYDFVNNKPILNQGKTNQLDSLGRALTQVSYQDFLDRK